jgi:hypothetical protein
VSANQAGRVTQDALNAYLVPKEVASTLRRSVKSFYRLLDADPSFPRLTLPGGGLLIPRVAFERWLADHTEGTKHPVRLAVMPRTSEPTSTHDAAGALK